MLVSFRRFDHSLESNADVVLGVYYPPLDLLPPPPCTPQMQKKSKTKKNIQSDHTIAKMGRKRASLNRYLCQGGMMNTVLN